MDSKERATVMLLHGGNEDRLRQVIAQGLVSKEVQQYIEEVLVEAEDARVYAETMQREVEKKSALIRDYQQREKENAKYYEKAVEAYKREERRYKENAERKETFGIAALGAGAFIVANILGRLIFGILFK